MVLHIFFSSTCELEEDKCEFVAILIYIVSFKPFRVTYWDYLHNRNTNTLPQQQ